MAFTKARVPSTRLLKILLRAPAVQRCATGSPARLTTASQPARVSDVSGVRIETG
jgi:hypothetical protein